MICLYEGGDRSNFTVGADKDGIQSGISKDLNGSIELKVLAKKVVQAAPSKEGKGDAVFLKIVLTKPQKFFLICWSTWPSFKCSFDDLTCISEDVLQP